MNLLSTYSTGLTNYMRKYADWNTLGMASLGYFFGYLSLVGPTYLNPVLQTESILDLKFTGMSSPDATYAFLERLGSGGRLLHFISDFNDMMFHCNAYLILGTLLCAKFLSRNESYKSWSSQLLLSGYLLDQIENLTACWLLFAYPFRFNILAYMLSWVTFFKWICLGSSFAILTYGLLENAMLHYQTPAAKMKRSVSAKKDMLKKNLEELSEELSSDQQKLETSSA